LGPANHSISADFCGYTRRMLEKELPGTLVLYTNGTAGDLNPYDCITNDFNVSRKAGEAVGAGALKCIRDMQFSEIGGFSQAVSEIRVVPHGEVEPQRMKQPDVKEGKITAPMHLLKLGGLLFVTLPGEPVVEVGNRIRDKSAADMVVPIGYANGSIGYLPTREMIPQGGLEVRRCPSHDVETPILNAFKVGMEKLGL
jgi:hypothetical protein